MVNYLPKEVKILEKRYHLIKMRKALQLTRKQLADELGISDEMVKKIEYGTANPGRETALKFEAFYQLSERVLFPDLYNGKDFTKINEKAQ
jgi:putative transcriptional regulator